MNIVFYSSNSNSYQESSFVTTSFPSCTQEWENLASEYPKDNFFVVTQKPATFLLDIDDDDKIESAKNVKTVLVDEFENKNNNDFAIFFAKKVLELKPDIAISATFYTPPYDWLGIQDSLIAEILEKNNVKTICNFAKTQLTCFDKNLTSQFLKNNNFECATSIYIHHQLFWCERENINIKTNIYKEYILSEINKLKFPIIIKDTCSLSSYSTQVLPTYKSTLDYLNSKKNNSDKIIEQYIEGIHFGTEIYESNGIYKVFPPTIFSLNQFGITSPKQSVKIGPITSEKYKINELCTELEKLAKLLCIKGNAQVDLIFANEKWYIIEINPRLSGLSCFYSVSAEKSLYKLLYQNATCKGKDESKNFFKKLNFNTVCNFKMPILKKEQLIELKKLDFVKYVHQIKNNKAKQIREKGYCEIIFGNTKDIQDLEKNLKTIAEKFPNAVESVFFSNAIKLIKSCVSDDSHKTDL